MSLATTFDNEKPLASPKPLHLSKDFTSTTKKPKTTGRPQTSSSKTVQINSKNIPTIYLNHLFLCLHCNFPMTEAHEMIAHQIECSTRAFKEKTETVSGKRKHYFLYCTECSAICNRTHFQIMKAHIRSTHCKGLKCGETYLFFRVEAETEALDVSHSKILCSNPLEHLSPEDQNSEPTLHQLSKKSSNESEDDEDSDELETDFSVQGFIQKKQMQRLLLPLLRVNHASVVSSTGTHLVGLKVSGGTSKKSIKTILCSNPLEHLSPEDKNYEPTLHQLSKKSSNESEDDEDSDELETDFTVQGFIQKKQMQRLLLPLLRVKHASVVSSTGTHLVGLKVSGGTSKKSIKSTRKS